MLRVTFRKRASRLINRLLKTTVQDYMNHALVTLVILIVFLAEDYVRSGVDWLRGV